jgi:hypothetical protein
MPTQPTVNQDPQSLELSVGFQKHVAKPVEPEALVRAILTLLEKDNPLIKSG